MSYWSAYKKVLKTNCTVLGFLVMVVLSIASVSKIKEELSA
jgi:hypothetical protein